MSKKHKTIIVGGGLAGMAAAKTLQEHSIDYVLLESSDCLGGKLNTVYEDNKPLDRGFQILLDSYGFIKDLDLKDCHQFASGAIILDSAQAYPMMDPFSSGSFMKFVTIVKDLINNPIFNLKDKILIVQLRLEVLFQSLNSILSNSKYLDQDVYSFLSDRGFSKRCIEGFFRPFFGAVFGDSTLETRVANLLFCYKAFAEGRALLTKNGLGQFIEVLSKDIDPDNIYLNTQVTKIQSDLDGVIVYAGDKEFKVDKLILATELETSCDLLDVDCNYDLRVQYHSFYFRVDAKSNLDKNIIHLVSNYGDESSLVNNFIYYDDILSVTVLDAGDMPPPALIGAVSAEIYKYAPDLVDNLTFLKRYRISGPQSLFKQSIDNYKIIDRLFSDLRMKAKNNIVLAGEYTKANCSQLTSYQSGVEAAEQIIDLL